MYFAKLVFMALEVLIFALKQFVAVFFLAICGSKVLPCTSATEFNLSSVLVIWHHGGLLQMRIRMND